MYACVQGVENLDSDIRLVNDFVADQREQFLRLPHSGTCRL